MTEDDDALAVHIARHAMAYEELCDSARGQDGAEVELLLREFAATYVPYLDEVDLVMTARVMSDVRWARKHPLSAIALALKYRDARPPHRSLLWLWRPRFVG